MPTTRERLATVRGARPGRAQPLRVRRRPGEASRGLMLVGVHALRVALGRGGIRANKREGDGGTPRGTFRLLRLWWRADRGPRPRTRLPLRQIRRDDAWCEVPAHRRYNKPFRLRPGQPGDRLCRDDHLYDFIVEIDHNTRPRVAGRGSAVFIHVARPGLAPTAGCIALRVNELRRLAAIMSTKTRIEIR